MTDDLTPRVHRLRTSVCELMDLLIRHSEGPPLQEGHGRVALHRAFGELLALGLVLDAWLGIAAPPCGAVPKGTDGV
jgi:hypothetical protein